MIVSRNRLMRDQLLSLLAPRFLERGFKFSRSQERAYKKTDFGKLIFQLGAIPHVTDVDIIVNLGIRHDALQELVHESDIFVRNGGKGTSSVGAELGNISQGNQRRWTLASEEDVPEVAASITEAFDSIALPYFERFSSLEAILDVTSGEDSWIHCPFHDARAKRAIAAAFLLGRRETFLQLVESKHKSLKERLSKGANFDERHIAAFDALAHRLSERWGTHN